MRTMQDEHHSSMEMLQRQLDHAENEMFRLQRVAQKSPQGDYEGVTEYIKDPRQTERPGAEVCVSVFLVVHKCLILFRLQQLQFPFLIGGKLGFLADFF